MALNVTPEEASNVLKSFGIHELSGVTNPSSSALRRTSSTVPDPQEDDLNTARTSPKAYLQRSTFMGKLRPGLRIGYRLVPRSLRGQDWRKPWRRCGCFTRAAVNLRSKQQPRQSLCLRQGWQCQVRRMPRLIRHPLHSLTLTPTPTLAL